MASRLSVWIRVVRVKFFLAGVPPAILGTVVSWYLTGMFNPFYFLLTLSGLTFAMAGCYTFNEYFDFKSGVDVHVRKEDVTPFSAGSRVLPEGLLQPLPVLSAGIIFWLLAFTIAAYLTLVRGWLVVPLALAGFFTGALYVLPPFKWAYQGLGEVFIGLTYGPLITLGSCYVQLAMLPPLELIALPSLVPGFLITAVIWINEFPDFLVDKQLGKKNLVVRLGRQKAVNVYGPLLITAYLTILVGVLSQLLPPTTLIALSTLPIAYKNIATAKKNYNNPQKLISAMSGTILLFTSTTLLLAAGYLVSTLINEAA